MENTIVRNFVRKFVVDVAKNIDGSAELAQLDV